MFDPEINWAVYTLTLIAFILIFAGAPVEFTWYAWCGIVYMGLGFAGLFGVES